MKQLLLLFFYILTALVGIQTGCQAQAGNSTTSYLTASPDWEAQHQTSYVLPESRFKDIWLYLTQTYGEQNISKLGTNFSSEISEEKLSDIYFDDPENSLLNNYASVRLRTYLSHAKAGQQQLTLSLPPSDTANMFFERNFSYTQTPATGISSDQHLLPLIGTGEEEEMNQALQAFHTKAKNLKTVLEIDQNRRRLDIRYKGRPFMTVTVDEFYTATNPSHLYELNLQQHQDLLTEASATEQQELSETFTRVEQNLLQSFPVLHASQLPKYNKIFVVLHQKPENKTATAIAWFALITLFLLVISIIIRQHRKRRSYTPASLGSTI